MFQSYLFPISYAFMTFPVAALFFTLPFLIVQYRRHGYINKVRALVLYLLLLYLMNAFYLVMLPLPASRHNLPKLGGALQPIPLQFIQDIMRESNIVGSEPSTYLSLLRERAFLQVIFNVLLMVPFGMFLNYYFRARWMVCILLSFGLSLFFEVTQITGIYGFYDYPHRVFDVDDLIANTLGGIIGYRIAEWISGLLPRIEQLDQSVDLGAKRVTYTRRGIAFMIDGGICMIGTGILYVFELPFAYWIATGIYFILLPYFTNGRTLGKWIVRIRVSGSSEHVTLRMLFVRYGLLYWVFFGLHVLLLEATMNQSIPAAGLLILQILVPILQLSGIIHLIIRMFKKNPVLLYEQISRTSHTISWPDHSPGLAINQ
ncbi:permease [Paenibacillus albidus]|uniref:Permease n=1 Tax=Paenibacillus albidus TaxID=2041023 RepID=A0A917C1D4_9BACL|nr:VanZ family protein [Paenibacillus albidus]GGF67250.1 permease [Paenibacillus albidus]